MTCTSCAQGYSLNNFLCKLIVIQNTSCTPYPNCATCNTTSCLICVFGFNLNANSVCVSCNIKNCKTCNLADVTICSQCLPGFIPSTNSKACNVPACPSTQSFIVDACKCPEHFYISGSQCIHCDDNCNLCAGANNCTKCFS